MRKQFKINNNNNLIVLDEDILFEGEIYVGIYEHDEVEETSLSASMFLNTTQALEVINYLQKFIKKADEKRRN